MTRGEALELIDSERTRQDALKASGRFKYTCADKQLTMWEKYAILVEEVGELSRAMLNRAALVKDLKDYREIGDWGEEMKKEITQVGAICLAWLESMEL